MAEEEVEVEDDIEEVITTIEGIEEEEEDIILMESLKRTPIFIYRKSLKMISFSKSVAIEQENKETQPEKLSDPSEEINENVGKEDVNEQKKTIEEKPTVSNTAGDRFFDNFVDSNQNEEGHRGRGDRYDINFI